MNVHRRGHGRVCCDSAMTALEGGTDLRLRSLSVLSRHRLAANLPIATQSDLYIHPTLIKPFERVCGVTWLRQHAIEKIFKLEPNMTTSTNLNRVYIIPSCLIKLKHVLDQINGVLSQTQNPERCSISVLVVPKALRVYESLVEEEGLSGLVALKSFQWELMYLDKRVLSLELPFMFKSVFVNKDATLLSSVSNSLWTLFCVMGEPKIFLSLGKQSSSVLEMYDIYCNSSEGCTIRNESEFGALLIVDRDQDYASGLLTPGTYSGLLYEIFNVRCGDLELDVENTKYHQGKLNFETSAQKKENAKKSIKMPLDSSFDSIYSEIKYLHFSGVFSILSTKAKDLNIEGTNMSKVNLSQMKQMISTKLQQIITIKKCLSNHILACETIVSTLSDKFEDIQITERSMLYNKNRKSNLNYIDENLSTDANMFMCLKLMCLLTLTQGMTTEEYNTFLTKYLQAFGYKYLYVFQNLISAGLVLPPYNAKFQLGIPNISSISEKLPRWQSDFQVNANKLKQLPNDPENVAVKEPTCPSFVFNGSYVPIVAAISKIILSADSTNDLVTKLSPLSELKIGGSIIDSTKTGIDELGEKLSNLQVNGNVYDIDIACRDLKTFANILKNDESINALFPIKPRSLLVYVVGGITQAEIAACRLVEKLTGGQIIVASDFITTSEHLLQSTM